MKCPYCAHLESKVVDSRPADEGSSIRRRRECLSCHKRFTTYETMESLPLVVIKKDGSRQAFDKSKLLGSMLKACEKRSVPMATLEKIADEIEQSLQNEMEREVSSAEIGELVMERLKDVDEVSYVRFASVYRQFKDISTFMAELNKRFRRNDLFHRRPAGRLFCAHTSQQILESGKFRLQQQLQLGGQPPVGGGVLCRLPLRPSRKANTS